jgi:hypothetical protein
LKLIGKLEYWLIVPLYVSPAAGLPGVGVVGVPNAPNALAPPKSTPTTLAAPTTDAMDAALHLIAIATPSD